MTTTAPYRPRPRAGRDGFAHLLHAEWTKFRTVRGWVTTMVIAALVTVLLGLLAAAGSHASCSEGPVEVACPAVPVGPGGEAVEDQFYFAHRSLTGNGDITARLTSMTGIITYPPPDHDKIVPGLVPWAKAGVIVKDGTRQGSAYAAMMVTGSHGVRMQHNFTEDTAGRPGGVSAASPRWLRLTRSGDTLTGYESADGTRWTKVGTAHLAGLPATVQIGLFVASPGDLTVKRADLGGSIEQMRFTQATAVFDNVGLRGDVPGGAWSRDAVGVTGTTDWERYHRPNGVLESGGTFTVTGAGDLAPRMDGQTVERTLTGALTGLILVIVVAVMFVTGEYRRGMIRTTLLAGPRRGRTLAAKALVIGAVTFVAALAATTVTVTAGKRILRSNGNYILPVSPLTELRVVVGVAALFGVAAVLALALGAVFRRGVAAIVTAVVVIVVPSILATVSVLPEGAARWLLRLTPAAGFAIQQSVPEYPQVTGHYVPQAGYYPLAPWAGLAVLCAYAALALVLAVVLLRRRDA
ncbi:ABC-2 family transporter protein [Streptosporangium subroseum]|uniref:ABC-2 family transporter protein n=1 Tax=Streptosporangium subroseum TaxID=106412 RepID=A0A239HS86_9ACTN|nr:ABC transporter permease subunit [Streptosporangium subroseum]SNS84091.1 ABC-2 family transporter protein [Streptosporangium subroseum]